MRARLGKPGRVFSVFGASFDGAQSAIVRYAVGCPKGVVVMTRSVNVSLLSGPHGQSLRIPADLAFPSSVTEVKLIPTGSGLLIVPKSTDWRAFLTSDQTASPDFTADQKDQPAEDRDWS
jgi:virulence-associated protein VagC